MDLAPDDSRLGLTAHAELLRQGGWLVPRRLPAAGREPTIDPGLLESAGMPAGVRLEFTTDARALEWDVDVRLPKVPVRPLAPFDVVVDGRRVARRFIEGTGVVAVDGLPAGRKRVQIWLPQYGSSRLGRLRLRGASLVVPTPARSRWITYGSSITHCTGADGPSETWPGLIATANDWHLRCLGFAGECHLDPVVARYIRDTPADLISLCVGVNIHGASSFAARSLAPALVGFVQTIRDGHPRTPIVLITPIAAPERERATNAVGLSLGEIRQRVAAVAVGLRSAGDDDLHVLDGLTVLCMADGHLLPDGLHPNQDGFRLIAERLAPRLAGLLAAGSGRATP
ncbi:SGNH/GDSL hydrolase family protein [Micromonospora sp. NPDC023966]|uniref:SGNH/GDSL hydrolase family protein n=1 Tax=Micromonospora sp. NPDC023966 TaxID=3154699 RepID=UPI0033ED7ABF